ncbi:DUF5610 domain-containing protein [Oceanicoccus sp. KOV_DT_Chl]|uniref:DUF5610 domain-containing protein n=1 Tax=Oceanicoccus sp. KOV_DT_Chl TaxID=1904639 RepID=UPI000C7A35F5|nr:DUF5610 domain-containing protein [Oceanicoccus sp. KOV_DT_Chl]
MDISSLIKSPLSGKFPSQLPAKPDADGQAQSSRGDSVYLSDRGRGLASGSQQSPASAAGYEVIPADRRPTPAQSAETILGFIGNQIKGLAADGASTERLEQAFNAALKGFKQGLGEAKEILEGFSMLDDTIAAGIDVTEQLVMDGLAALKQEYLPNSDIVLPEPAKTPARSKVVTAYQQQSFEQSSYNQSRAVAGGDNSIRNQALSYAESYRSNGAVSLSLQTQDGDIIQLTFSASAAANESAALVRGSLGGSQGVGLSYSRETSTSNQFSVSVNGQLDAGEREALSQLLSDVSSLSDEFFNGDFNKAVELAMAFEMDASEFSAMSLDLSRSTSVSMVESFATTAEGSNVASMDQIISASTDGLRAMVEELLQMMEQAKTFAEPKQLLSNLLSNQLAQLDVGV